MLNCGLDLTHQRYCPDRFYNPQENISNEKFEATEILFEPFLFGVEQNGIHEMTFDSINVKYNKINIKYYLEI